MLEHDELQELQAEAERLDTQPGQNSDVLAKYVMFPPGDGAITVRLLPKAAGRKFYCGTRTHKLNNRNIHCPKELQGTKYVGECEICKYYNWLWKQSEEPGKTDDERNALQAKARSIKPVERYYYNCIVRSETDPNTQEVRKNVGPKILSIGKMLHKMIIRAIVGAKELDEPALGDVTDVEKGRDFKIIKEMVSSGTMKYPQYNRSKFLDVSTAGTKDEVAGWLENLHDLQALRVLKNQEELEHELKLYLGVIKDEKNSFDPTKFQKPTASVEEQVAASKAQFTTPVHQAPSEAPKAPAAQQTVPPNLAPKDGGDDIMADAEFLAQLKTMK